MYTFNIMVTAKEYTSGTDSAWWHVRGGITRDTGAATTAIVGTNTTETGATGGAATWTFTATADTTNGSLKLEVQNVGAGGGTNVKWVAVVEVAKVSV
jgi:hypothetical protein